MVRFFVCGVSGFALGGKVEFDERRGKERLASGRAFPSRHQQYVLSRGETRFVRFMGRRKAPRAPVFFFFGFAQIEYYSAGGLFSRQPWLQSLEPENGLFQWRWVVGWEK